jgi:rubrerythrin
MTEGGNMQKDLTAIEVVGVAIGKEREAQELYTRMANEIKNPLVREKFLSLSREEKMHEEILTKIYKKMTGESRADAPKLKFKEVEPPKPDATFDELFVFAIEREREAQRMYLEAARNSTDESGRRTFQYLADFERGHEILLQGEFEDYKRDRNWYADMPDIQLVGP